MATGKIETYSDLRKALYHTRTVTVRASASTTTTYNMNASVPTISGYTPVAIAGWNSSGMTYLSIANMYLDGGKVYMSGRNLGSSAVTPSFNVTVLYMRNT